MDKLSDRNEYRKLEPNLVIQRSFSLITYTDGMGQIPEEVSDFLAVNYRFLTSVIGSGNRNFGKNFCAAASKISELYSVPLLLKFELSGMPEDVKAFETEMAHLGTGLPRV